MSPESVPSENHPTSKPEHCPDAPPALGAQHCTHCPGHPFYTHRPLGQDLSLAPTWFSPDAASFRPLAESESSARWRLSRDNTYFSTRLLSSHSRSDPEPRSAAPLGLRQHPAPSIGTAPPVRHHRDGHRHLPRPWGGWHRAPSDAGVATGQENDQGAAKQRASTEGAAGRAALCWGSSAPCRPAPSRLIPRESSWAAPSWKLSRKAPPRGSSGPEVSWPPPGGQQGEPHSRERAESRLHHRLLQDAPRAAQSLLGRAALPAPPSEVITKSLELPACVRIRVCLEKEDDKNPCICRAEHRRCFYHRLPCREGHRALWEESHRAISGHTQLTEQF